MPIPSLADIEIPLLLELARSGGTVRKAADFPAFHERVAKHFPALTPEDKQLRRQTGEHNVWLNTVDWTRNQLREKHELNGGQRGVWEITQAGKERLRRELRERDVRDVEGFIGSDRSLPEELGPRWRPRPLRPRNRGSRPIREPGTEQPAPPIVGQPITPEVGTAPEPSPPLRPDIHQQLLERLQSLGHLRQFKKFEPLVGEFLKAKGLVVTRSRGGPGDEGVDGECEVPFLKVKVAFQAKCHARDNSVGSPAIRNFKGGLIGRFDRGIFITTSTFTPGAKEEAEQPGMPLVLIDGNELVNQMIDLRLGIREKPVVETQIDESFFEGLGS